jgi:hypothetical protein
MRDKAFGVIQISVATILFMSIALLNGWPTVFQDTGGYYLLGEDVAQSLHLTKARIALTGQVLPEQPPPGQAGDDGDLDPLALASRSSTYGFFFYVTQRIGTTWLTVAAQAAAAATLVYMLWRKGTPNAPRWTFFVLAPLLAACTSVAFFAAFLMPDIFAGVAGAALLLLVIWPDRLNIWEKIGLWSTLCFSIACHTANAPGILVVGGVAAAVMKFRRTENRAILKTVGPVFLAIVASLFLHYAFIVGVKARTGVWLHNMPFLAARVIADGPGRAYLFHACDNGVKYALCDFRHSSLDVADDILWSFDPKHGVMLVANQKVGLTIAREQPRFLAGVIAYDPAGVLTAMMRNWGRQLGLFYTGYDPIMEPDFFFTDPYWKTTNTWLLLPDRKLCKPIGPGCTSPLTDQVDTITALQGVTIVMSLLIVFASLVAVLRQSRRRRPPGSRPDAERLVSASLLAIVFVIANAAVCGMASGPYPRYEARLIWLLPAMAGLLAISMTRPRRTPS